MPFQLFQELHQQFQELCQQLMLSRNMQLLSFAYMTVASSLQDFPLADSNSSSSSSSSSKDDSIATLIQQDQDECYEIINSVRPEIVKRFKMRRELFLYILNDVKAYGCLGLFFIQKMITVVRILAYGCATDHYDEYIKIGESTAIKCLKAFCNAIVAVYVEEYMCPPNEADITRLLEEGEQRRFLGMLGSIDCMHWEWKNCPVEWHGTHRGCYGNNTLILEAIASQDLWI
ncbi:uncharacterized protein LOC132281200 [Cornus florida]|uniref:uncharacterized protein LOC132281200 n=1 Tax=Cornus florida TaxID=4283 RepID=UPI002899D7B5|nr:uncharacterized protein LOC132281200 [Cornus florida]